MEHWRDHVRRWARTEDSPTDLVKTLYSRSLDAKYALLAAIHDLCFEPDQAPRINPWPDDMPLDAAKEGISYLILKLHLLPDANKGCQGLDESESERLQIILDEVAQSLVTEKSRSTAIAKASAPATSEASTIPVLPPEFVGRLNELSLSAFKVAWFWDPARADDPHRQRSDFLVALGEIDQSLRWADSVHKQLPHVVREELRPLARLNRDCGLACTSLPDAGTFWAIHYQDLYQISERIRTAVKMCDEKRRNPYPGILPPDDLGAGGVTDFLSAALSPAFDEHGRPTRPSNPKPGPTPSAKPGRFNRLSELGEELAALLQRKVCGEELARLTLSVLDEAERDGAFRNDAEVRAELRRWRRRTSEKWDEVVGQETEDDPAVITFQRIVGTLFSDLRDTEPISDDERAERIRRGLPVTDAGKCTLHLWVQWEEAVRRLADHLRQLAGECGSAPVAQAASARPAAISTPVDFVILTALEEERDALLALLPGYRKVASAADDVRVYFEAELRTAGQGGSPFAYRLMVVSPLSMGRVNAATVASDAIRRWRPRYLLLVGVAGGVSSSGVNLGDLLVANQIVDYELQKVTDGASEIRPWSHPVDARLLAAAQAFAADKCLPLMKSPRPCEGITVRDLGAWRGLGRPKSRPACLGGIHPFVMLTSSVVPRLLVADVSSHPLGRFSRISWAYPARRLIRSHAAAYAIGRFTGANAQTTMGNYLPISTAGVGKGRSSQRSSLAAHPIRHPDTRFAGLSRYPILQIPYLFRFRYNVLGLIPSFVAASAMLAAEARIRRMCSASICSIVSGSPADDGFALIPCPAWFGLPICDGRSANATKGPAARITPRSMALRSSRMFPGQA